MPPRRRPRTQTDSERCGAPSCNRLVTNDSGGVQCSECPTWFHIRFGGFSRAVHIPEHWQCPLCSSTRLTQALENLRITTESPENFNPDNDNQEVPNDDVNNFFKKQTPTLNRVPKGAQRSLAELFKKLLAVCSDDSIAPDTAETLQQLAERHPRRTTPLKPRNPISTSGTVTANVVKTAILFFPAGSAGCPTGMCPQILKDLISPSNGDAGTRLREKLTEFVNLAFSGNLPPRIRPILFGANLIALGKK